MQLQEKYNIEGSKWDSIAQQEKPGILRKKNFADYAHSHIELEGVAEFLGDLRGKHILEYGCGRGYTSVFLAKSGAFVTAFDLSPASVEMARGYAVANGVSDSVEFFVAAGEDLPFRDESFDLVFGKSVLHHIDVDEGGGSELYRIVKTGGKAAFCEPMGMNPILNFAREHLPYRGKSEEHGADVPLNYSDIRKWGKDFSYFSYRELQLFSMVERAFGFDTRFKALERFDDLLLRHVPPLRRFCRSVVMFMRK